MSRLPAERTIVILLSAGALLASCADERPTNKPYAADSWGAESDRIFYNARPKARRATASQFTYTDNGPTPIPSGYYADYPQYDGQLPDSRALPPGSPLPVASPTATAPLEPAAAAEAPPPEVPTVSEEEQASKLKLARVKMRAAYENFKDAIRPAADYLRVESKRVYYESKFAIGRAIEAFREAQQDEQGQAQADERARQAQTDKGARQNSGTAQPRPNRKASQQPSNKDGEAP